MAGFETAAQSLAFALLEIARHPEVQTKLYEEVMSVLGSAKENDLTDGFDHSVVETLPYLTAVVNETLRVHSAAHSFMLVASKDIVIPLSRPIRGDSNEGVKAIPVKKGQRMCHLDGFNHLEEVWGKDAHEFKPERWIEMNETSVKPENACDSPYANIATFGAGPKVCLGWRFAVLEMQVFLAVIVRHFELTISDPNYVLWRDGSFAGTVCSVAFILSRRMT
ncbi:cytochrome P450 [Calocera cornea HHB12733]|uniref:Cytochrome P450 n=1 Tax=Calocera cornea HHB12733 TaxID=1353952 RepID=A0A165EHN3_9BASI|nr:cytochrome P450 [Calocera cornea HHB12733]